MNVEKPPARIVKETMEKAARTDYEESNKNERH